MTTKVLDELMALARHAAAGVPPFGWPSAAPTPGQSREQWVAEVAALRAQHDAQALYSHVSQGTVEDDDDAECASRYVTIPTPAGRLAGLAYQPQGEGPFPAIVMFHGGGWWMGGGAAGYVINDRLCRRLCTQVGAVVVNLDYRLAPEHRFPAQLDDGYAAVQWMAAGAHLSLDPARLAILGISSGGHLAAGLSQLVRDRGGPRIALQILIQPALDLALPAGAAALSADVVEGALRLRGYYFRDTPLTAAYASPLDAGDLSGTPPTVLMTGLYDPLREQGQRYADLVTAAGIEVRHLEHPATHTVATADVRARRDVDLVAAIRGLI